MDHSAHTRLTPDEINPAVLLGCTVYGPDDYKIGQVSHVHGSGPDAEVVLDVGGFLGIGAKPVAVPMNQLEFMRDEDGEVHAVTSWTKDELEEMPEYRN